MDSTREPPLPGGPEHPSRREFLSSSGRIAGVGWLAMNLPLLSGLAGCARDAAERGEPLRVLTPEEGRTLAALADTILPPDDLPGAAEAGAVHFVDGALDTLFPDFLPLVRPGLEELDRRAAGANGGEGSFADLPDEDRAAVVREVEPTPFFQVTRMLVVMGMFSDPAHGGNRDGVGWEVLGMVHSPVYEPPFGHYDRGHHGDEEAGAAGAGADAPGAARRRA